ncbi:MAG: type VI secretion system TssO [Polaribacter sp.]
MKPKNIKERRNSFLKFLLLFLITSGTIVTAIFFTFKVPVKENNTLKAQAKKINTEIIFQNSFSNKMKKVRGMIDSLDVPGQNTEYLNQLIGKNLAEMQKSIPTKDSTYRYDMYSSVVNLFLDIQDMKEDLSELKDAENTIEEYKEALEKSEQENKQLRRDLLITTRRR